VVSDSRSQSSAAATTGSPEAVRHLPRSSCVTAYPSTTAPRVVCRAIRRTGPGQTNPGGFMATTTTPSEGGLPDPRTRHPNHDQRCPLHPRAGPTAIVLKRRRPAPADHTAPPSRVVLPAFGADQGRIHSSLLGTTRHRLERGVRKPVTRRCPAEAPVTTHSRPRTAEVADPATTDRAGIEMPHGSRARITPHCVLVCGPQAGVGRRRSPADSRTPGRSFCRSTLSRHGTGLGNTPLRGCERIAGARSTSTIGTWSPGSRPEWKGLCQWYAMSISGSRVSPPIARSRRWCVHAGGVATVCACPAMNSAG